MKTTIEHDKCLEYIEKHLLHKNSFQGYSIYNTGSYNFTQRLVLTEYIYTKDFGYGLTTPDDTKEPRYEITWDDEQLPNITEDESKNLYNLCVDIESIERKYIEKQIILKKDISLKEFYES